MTFESWLDQAIDMLRRRGRVSYRALKLQLGVDDDILEALKEELVEVHHLAVDVDGRMLAWTGGAGKVPEAPPDRKTVSPETHPAHGEAPFGEGSAGEAERRQLTVMFCDLVGSTALSGQLDPEDLRAVVRAYQESCAAVIQRYGGHIAQYLGDGLLVYFGYPTAHEDDAQRAVHAGLGILVAMGSLNARLVLRYRVELAVRVGIHTGPVVVGDVGHEQLALGETPNVAARLQGVAAPNGVVVSAHTRRLLGGLFDLDYLGVQALRGVGGSMAIYAVRGESAVESRFEAATATGLTPLVGRDEEIDFLLRCWGEAKAGAGRVVLLTSDAGIGKSRLTQALRERLAGELHIRLRYQSSPYHVNSAFYPIITQVERAAQFARDDTPEEKQAKLTTLLEQSTTRVADVLPLFRALLNLPPADHEGSSFLSPQQRKQKTIEALVDQLIGLASRQPVLFVWEDAHWSDPSSLDVLDLLVSRVRDARALVVITSRVPLDASWMSMPHVTELALGRLDQAQVAAMLGTLTAGKALPVEVRDQILAKTDGVPLFVEELTKTILESGLLADAGDRFDLTGPLPRLAIPDTLHDSLTARLDRLSPIKEIAQVGAVIGREFAYEHLAAVAPMPDEELELGLQQLVHAGLLFRRGQGRDADYIFKHALVRDTAYDSLLRSRRQQLHARVAQTLVERFAAIADIKPEVVAHHYTEGGCAEEAVAYWQQAGQQASVRSANVEAVSHLSNGLKALDSLPAGRSRAQRELDMQMALGPALVATRGYADRRVGQAYDRAWQLCQELGDRVHAFSVRRGQQVHHVARGELVEAERLAEEVLAIAEEEGDVAQLVGGHYALGSTQLFKGDLTEALAHFECGIALYAPEQQRLLRWPGSHPGIQCHFYRALIMWARGYPEQAVRQGEEAIVRAQSLSHPFTNAQTLCMVALLHAFGRAPELARVRAEASIELCGEHGMSFWLGFARAVHGWALTRQGRFAEGLVEMRDGIATYRAVSGLLASLTLALHAEALVAHGRVSDARAAIADALDMVRRGEGWWEAEVHRLRGEVELGHAASDTSRAEACFHEALDTARRQHAKSLELRAATSLCRVWLRNGKRHDAHALLGPLCAWFTEGFDTADFRDAKSLLAELEGRAAPRE